MSEGLKFPIFVLPDGRLPERKTDGAVGFDVSARAIVCANQMNPDPNWSFLRRTKFDFKSDGRDNPEYERTFVTRPSGDPDYPWDYGLLPGKHALVGVGFCIQMPPGYFMWVTPRSGLATKIWVTLSNGPGTVDWDYNGEAGGDLENNGSEIFWISQKSRIAQIIFQKAPIPEFIVVGSHSDLRQTTRGAGGFGSTGERG